MQFDLAEKPVIAITGSAGKTTVKAMVSSVLRQKWNIFEAQDYHNTTDKTMLHAQQIGPAHQAAVLEYAMAYPGVIAEHCRIIRPNIGVITNVGVAHIGNFGCDLKRLAAAKSELIKGMHPAGILFINADDPNSRLLDRSGFAGRVFSIAIESKAQIKAKTVRYLDNGMSFLLCREQDNSESFFTIPNLGRHNVYNALFAAGIAEQLGFSTAEIQSGLLQQKRPRHRLDIYNLKGGITLIDDTVHANPLAVRAALDVLADVGEGEKYAVLGRMPELGELKYYYHEEIGRYSAVKKINALLAYGSTADCMVKGALQAGFPANRVRHYKYTDREQMYADLTRLIQPGSTVLVKGASRLGMFEIVRFLRKRFC